MSPGEVRPFLFRTPAQWQHGVGFRLGPLDAGGFELFAAPAFERWITRRDEARSVTSLAIGESGRALWMHRADGWLFGLDPVNRLIEPLVRLTAATGPGPSGFGRMLLTRGRIWLHDRAGTRLLALRADTFQIIAEMHVPSAVDVALIGDRLFVVEPGAVRVFDSDGGRAVGGFAIVPPIAPLAVAAQPQGPSIDVIDAGARAFQRFTLDGRCRSEVGRFDDVAPTFTPCLLCADADGHLFASDGGARVHQFAPDGGYVGDSGALGPIERVSALATGPDGALYVADREGLARFGRQAGAAGHDGAFYSGTLDSGRADTLWHRLDLQADLDEGGGIDVYYATSNESGRAERVAAILGGRTGAAERASAIDRLMRERPDEDWRGPFPLRAAGRLPDDRPRATSFSAPPTHSVLFDRQPGRYLWLKIVISALGPRGRAAVRELRVLHPRQSYLRYLPAVYQADQPSREFLERYLSIFETVLSGPEATIDRTPELFDPWRTPPEFLDWLAQWLDLAVEEDWPDAVKRRLIARAADLYARKGTPDGLADFVEIITGVRPIIRESFRDRAPSLVGASGALGVDARLQARPMTERPRHEYTRLGDDARLGRAPLERDREVPVDPFVAAAHRFTVLLSLPARRYRRLARGLERAVREQSPAHAAFELRVADSAGLGQDAVVGVNWRVVDPQPLHLGASILGRAICRRRFSYGPELGVDATLMDIAEGGGDRAAICAGE